MEPFNAYLPIDRRQALARNAPLPGAALGAVLVADIAGFTPLTATLAQELGPQRGADELTRQLNQIYTVLVNSVHAYRGSVVHFGGDSITCWFDDAPIVDAADLPGGTRRATACAFAMQRSMARFRTIRTPANTVVTMAIKVAVTAGPVRRFLVGQAEVHFIEVLAGRLLDRTAAAEAAARQGEIIVGSEVLGHFGSGLAIRDWRPGADGEFFAVVDAGDNGVIEGVPPSPWPNVSMPETAMTERWVLAVLRRRLQEGQDAFLAELRQLIAVFIGFDGIDYDGDEGAASKLNEYITWVQSELARFEGQLLRVTMGDKGSYLYGVFGAPIAHEDDALRAVSVAEALQTLPDTLQFIRDTRIGISQGLMYVGPYGAPQRRTFGVQGNETNIAARLMEKAQSGQIVVSAQVANATQHAYAYNDLGDVALKGVARPMPIFTMARPRRRPATSVLKGRSLAPIIGRSREQQVLMSCLQALQHGQSQTVTIEGEAGIGKSRLVMAHLEEVTRAALPLLLIAGSAIEQTTAYHAWRPLFRQIFELDAGDDPQAARQRVLARLAGDDELVQLAPLFNAVLPVRLPENELTGQMTGEARANSTRDLLSRTLADAYRRSPGLVLVVEDAQWLDSASWALMTRVRQTVDPLLTVVVARPDGLPDEYRHRNGETDVQRVQLGPLSARETVALVCHRLEVQELPAPVAAFIQQQAEGHPFFSEEIAYALRDAGHLRIRDGRSYLSDEVTTLQELNFPATIQGVITSRIDRLEADQQLTLKVASVIGRVFAMRALSHIFPAAEMRDRLPLYLEMLTELDIVVQEVPEPDVTYIFKHSITQEVVYSLMTYAQRKRLHRAAARWYEQRHGDDLTAYYGLLAHHWTRADEPDKALDYLDRAGRQALRNFANSEAIAFFSRALALDAAAGRVGDDGRRAQWDLLLGEAYVHWTRYGEGRQHLERGLQLLGRPVPRSGMALYLVGAILLQLLYRLWPRRVATADEDEREQLLASSRAFARLVEVYYHFGEVLLSIYATFRSLNLAERAGDSPELAEAYAPVAVFFSFLRRYRWAEAYFRRAVATARRLNSLPALAYVLLVKATYDTSIGNWTAAEEGIGQLSDIGLQLGARRRYNDGLQLLTILQYLRGDFNACLITGEQLLFSARQLNDLRFQGWALYAQTHASFRLGRMASALTYLSDLEAIVTAGADLRDEQLVLNMHGLAALVRLRHDDMEGALAAAEQALSLTMGSLQTSYYTLSGYAGPANVYLAHWRAAPHDSQRRQQARKALRALARFAGTFPVGRPSAELYHGDFHRQDGRPRRAIRRWQEALSAAEQLGMSYQAGWAHYRLGRYPLKQGPDSLAHLEAARDHLTAVGAEADLAIVRQALEEAGSASGPSP